MKNDSTRFQEGYYNDNEGTRQSDTTKLLLGALAGAALGTMIASLYTEKGIEVRKSVSDRSREFASGVKEKTTEITGGIKEKVSNISTDIMNKFEATKEAAASMFMKQKQHNDSAALHTEYGYNFEENEISKPKVALGILAASLAGTIVWSLTTDKGRETLSCIGENSRKFANDIKVKMSGVADNLAEQYSLAKEGAKELLEHEDVRLGNQTYNNRNSAPDYFAE